MIMLGFIVLRKIHLKYCAGFVRNRVIAANDFIDFEKGQKINGQSL